MRSVRLSQSAERAFYVMLAQGTDRFGTDVVEAKLTLVLDCLRSQLAQDPRRGRHDAGLNLYTYQVAKTPFVLVYEFDEAEVRVVFIVHKRADRNRLDPTNVVW